MSETQSTERRITVDPITRLEGHGKIDIFLDDAGNVANAYFQVPELRGFEKFVEGMPVEEVPRVVTRICGVCPGSHHMAAGKAVDAVYHVDPPPTAKKLRELLYSAFYTGDHTLHFYALGGPDFVVGPTAPAAERNILAVIGKVGLEAPNSLTGQFSCACVSNSTTAAYAYLNATDRTFTDASNPVKTATEYSQTPGYIGNRDGANNNYLAANYFCLAQFDKALSSTIKPSPIITRGLCNTINEGEVGQAVFPVGEITALFSRIVQPFQRVLLTLTAMICIVSGISILVSIYNSMNDRRREIPIMRSLGAGRRTVMAVVLLESIILSLGGGLLGWVSYAYGCTVCRSGFVRGGSTHADNGINLGFGGELPGGATVTATYSQGNAHVAGNGFGNCTATYCHGTDNNVALRLSGGANQAGSPNVPTWDNAQTGCAVRATGLRGATRTTRGRVRSGPGGRTRVTCDNTDAMGPRPVLACSDCHTAETVSTHVNGRVDFRTAHNDNTATDA